MHQINGIVVKDGQMLLSQIPFSDGQHVHATITEIGSSTLKMPIAKVRELLKGPVKRFDYPTDPLIPEDAWEMGK